MSALSNGLPDHPADSLPDWTPEWQAEQDREAIQRQFRSFTNAPMSGAEFVSEALAEEMTPDEYKELADEMHRALDGYTILPNFLDMGRIVHGALARYARKVALKKREISL